ncbi:NAD-binding Rossmann fold oxidoreductase [Pholiota conissans]|uniref:NAD-binding Rossmann fold oxidoreductase n=1 Tax=Pholiota conissans TaxID=109636 RepID=A0A9P6CXS1_9AGAR|nr:NAD-binding Rossmann fold oxidoreductase [Pholiota conissans]
MSQPIKVGFIGLSTTGWAASALAPSLLQPSLQGKYNLVAVSTTSEGSAKASAEKYSTQTGHAVTAHHGDSSLISSNPNVELVAVSVKAPMHKQVVLPVIEKKRDFFIEWPAGRNLKETIEIAEAAHRQGVKSFVGLQARNSPVIQKVKELISSGAIGSVRSTTFVGLIPRETHFWPPVITPEYVFALDKANGVTALNIAGGHQLDALTYLLGDFSTINATATTIYPTATVLDANGQVTSRTISTSIPDQHSISGVLKSGALATISTSGRKLLLWEIDGEEGSIRMESNSSVFINLNNPTLYLNGERVEVEGSSSETVGILGSAWAAYADGKKGQYATIDDAVKNHRLLDAIDRSLAEGKTIVL